MTGEIGGVVRVVHATSSSDDTGYQLALYRPTCRAGSAVGERRRPDRA